MKLTERQYMDLSLASKDIEIKKLVFQLEEQKCQNRNLELEAMRLKAVILQKNLPQKMSEIDLAKKKYEEIKKGIEEALGQSIDGHVINDVTLEVQKLEPLEDESPKK